MIIHSIFELVNESLFSIRFDHEPTDEFSRLFNSWQDVEYLEAFFEDHQEDLDLKFWRGISIEDAISKTIRDARKLEQKLIQIAESGKTSKDETLTSFFKPLSNSTTKFSLFEKNKVTGLEHPSWLRIYAIRLEVNLFVISGGGIKLTQTMNEREHLRQELQKLEIVKNYLQNQDNIDLLPFELF